MSSITQLISSWRAGDSKAETELLKLVYPEIKIIARQQLRKNRQCTLRPTEIANDVFMKLRGESGASTNNSAQLYALSAHMIRCFIVDHIRQAQALKRGSDYELINLDFAKPDFSEASFGPMDWLTLDEALNALAAEDSQYATLVELRFFMGMTIQQTAEVMEISTATVGRIWRYARAFLARALDQRGGANG